MNIYEISTKVRNIYEELRSGVGVNEETGEIDPAILKELELSKNELNSKAIDYGYVLKAFEDEIDMYDKEIKRLQTRKKRLQNVYARLEERLKNAMVEFNIEKIEGKMLTLSLRDSSAVEIEDFEKLDSKYKFVKIINEADKVAIKEAIKSGVEVEGAKLVKRKNLNIR